MAEIRTVTTLRSKRGEILRTIAMYEEKLDQARADLAHITAVITIFEGAHEGLSPRAYVDVELAKRLKKYGFPATEASITNKLKRRTFSASWFLACLATLGTSQFLRPV